MHIVQNFNSFQFYNYFSLKHEINPVSGFKLYGFVNNRQSLLPLEK